ncbi:molybdate ABC transporter substrate-binding protein [Variovorax sp. J22R133]|uniref:molybdate ABC transporter substrate-binding protein n=1 Tax=Variovorax brevis TaxID=3053503 RepID=UPI002576F1EE|nr:molybdate ABC transporter substrate-binding protein [Variovorax sp. J22R133]MDM0110769.1 molybdate ABC transporter substrate-binding protein [Variovorax sp. J22R133]
MNALSSSGLALAAVVAVSAAHAQAVQLYAAGSLRESLTDIARQYESDGGQPVKLTFGASGLLRERIEKGEPAQVFASADMQHPQRLAQTNQWDAPVVFARNLMCVLASPSIDVNSGTLLDAMLAPGIRVGTSTPKADPSGDYAWELFRRADALRPGAFTALDAKALKLTGAPGSAQPPAGRGTYGWIMEEGKADLFVTYCTNAAAALREVPRLQRIEVPADLQVAASYGLTVRRDAGDAAARLVQYILSPAAQAVLRRYGFGAPVP